MLKLIQIQPFSIDLKPPIEPFPRAERSDISNCLLAEAAEDQGGDS